MMPWIMLLFFLLAGVVFVSWSKSHRVSLIFFVLFLVAFLLVFNHHATDSLPISL